MSIGTAIDADLAIDASLRAHVELYRAAVLGGEAESIRRARLDCESALEAKLDAIDAMVKAGRDQRRRRGL